jgi:hypothetical protein
MPANVSTVHQVTDTVWAVSSPTFSVLFATEELAQQFCDGLSGSDRANVSPLSVFGTAPSLLQAEDEYVEHPGLFDDAVRIIKNLGYIWKDGSWHGRVCHEPVAEIVECPVMGQQTVQEIDGRWKVLRCGDKLYTSPQSIIDELLGVLQQINEQRGHQNDGTWAANIASAAIFRASQWE